MPVLTQAHTSLAAYTAADFRAGEERLNNRPIKTLNWQTTAAIFDTAAAT